MKMSMQLEKPLDRKLKKSRTDRVKKSRFDFLQLS